MEYNVFDFDQEIELYSSETDSKEEPVRGVVITKEEYLRNLSQEGIEEFEKNSYLMALEDARALSEAQTYVVKY